uniref:Uncharacterized protein n=1 Tax=Timema tahoe TaxID=61484 RepID=A0A7R9FJH9_9NEOP|nr:unnamed protein product [Timema tahoe]
MVWIVYGSNDRRRRLNMNQRKQIQTECELTTEITIYVIDPGESHRRSKDLLGKRKVDRKRSVKGSHPDFLISVSYYLFSVCVSERARPGVVCCVVVGSGRKGGDLSSRAQLITPQAVGKGAGRK